MDWKEFFKPTISKIVVFVILSILSVFLVITFSSICFGGACPEGFPFKFMLIPGCASSDGITQNCWGFKIISFWGLIGNIIIWYLVTCLIVLGFNKLRKK